MTKQNRLQQRTLLYISSNCMFRPPPGLATLTIGTLLYNVPMSTWNSGFLVGWLAMVWVSFVLQQIYGMPVDIFEDFRQQDERQRAFDLSQEDDAQ